MPHSLAEPAGSRLIASLTANPSHQEWLEQALQLALFNHQQGGRPFAALLVRDNQLVTSAVNGMHQDGDPTRHAELEALRQASQVGPLVAPWSTPAVTPAPCA